MTARSWRVVAGLAVVAMLGVAEARPMDVFDHSAVMESLRYLPPNMRFREMRRLGLYERTPAAPAPESTGLRLVGKWGGGPSVKVTGRDSLVFLSRGSEVVAISFADTANPEVLSYIQVNGLVSRSVLVGDRLYVGSTGSDPKYIDVFDVANPAAPPLLGSIQTYLNDIAVQDTLVYAIADDSFKVFNFADPAHPRLLGACRDSGYVVSVCNGYAYLGDRWGLYVIDARNPASPHRVAAWGTAIISVTARNTICCATTSNPNQPGELNFSILDVADPALPFRTGFLANAGGYDMLLIDSLVFLSGYYTGGHEFRVISIADSTSPRHIGGCLTPGENTGVWVDVTRGSGYLADGLRGLSRVNIIDLANPAYDTSFLRAGFSLDVSVDGSHAYVANSSYGMYILDLSNPAAPRALGAVDSSKLLEVHSVVARDSFAYMHFTPSLEDLRAIDVTDPARPVSAGGYNVPNWPEDMVLRDSFLYVAESYNFQVFNVARPREPRLVGSCVLTGYSGDLDVQDTLAFLGHWPFLIVNIANPAAPAIVGSWPAATTGVDVEGSVAYLTCHDYCFAALDISDPTAPTLLDSLYLGIAPSDVAVCDTIAFAGDNVVHIISVADPRNLRLLGRWSSPGWIERVVYAAPYLYVACTDAGVCILEASSTGVSERQQQRTPTRAFTYRPSVTKGVCAVQRTGDVSGPADCKVLDVAGRVVCEGRMQATAISMALDMGACPAGVYVVEVRWAGGVSRGRLVRL